MKITYNRAQEMINKAYTMKSMRFGQALWTILTQEYEDAAQRNLGSGNDFYYEEDTSKVLEVFFNNFVEVG